MVTMLIGGPWQMIVVDVLKVLSSTCNNKYLLVIQNYFIYKVGRCYSNARSNSC